jgi:nitrogen fixation NifU-like protein
MSDLRELYQSVILDHNKSPRNFRRPPGANRSAQGHNPLCGDQLVVLLTVEDGVVKDAGFQGSGCAISTASASLMTESVKGRRLEDVEKTADAFQRLLTSDATAPAEDEGLGKLAVFGGVREFPMRVKCATLAWHTLRAALHGSHETATTE